MFNNKTNYMKYFKSIFILIITLVNVNKSHSQTICNCNDTIGLRYTLNQLFIKDQECRIKMYKPNSNNDSLWVVQDYYDSVNVITLTELFKTVPFCCLNNSNSIAVEAVLSHTREVIRTEFFLPIIYQSIKDGNGNPYMYSNLLDQLKIFTGKKQIYGRMKCPGNVLCPIEDLPEINARRKAIGLGTIEEECIINGIKNPFSQ